MDTAAFLALFPQQKRNSPTDWHVPCPAHDDNAKDPAKFSLHVTATQDRILLHCFAGCTPEEILHALQLSASALFLSEDGRRAPVTDGPRRRAPVGPAPPPAIPEGPVTLEAFAALKRIPLAFLQGESWEGGSYYRAAIHGEASGLRIPYLTRAGQLWRQRFRFSLAPGAGFEWGPPKAKPVIPYGRHRLDNAIDRGELWLVEGESDAVTAWLHDLPALGIPGNLAAGAIEAEDLAGIDVLWIVQEPGQSGLGFALKTRERLEALRWRGTAKLVRLPAKDLSDLHVSTSDGFTAALEDAKALAVDLFAWIPPKDAETTPPKARPFSEGAGALLARQFPPIEVYIENILTSEGSGFIGGEEKLGKSYFALTEAIALALGITLCGRFLVPRRRRVLFIEEEDSPRRTQLRARAIVRGRGFDPDNPEFQADLGTWFHIAVWTGFRLDDPEWMARLDAELEAFPAEVCYLDVLRKLTGKDLNKADQASALFDSLDAIRRQHGVVFRVLHHFRKSQGFRTGRGSQELGGSYVLGAWAEQSIYLEPVGRKGGGTSFDVQAKDAAASSTMRLRWESDGPAHDPLWVRLHLDDVKPDQAPGEKYADQVETLLSTLPTEPSPYGAGVTVRALAQALKRGDDTVRRTLKFLIETGRCTANGSPGTKLRRYSCTAPEKQQSSVQAETQEKLL